MGKIADLKAKSEAKRLARLNVYADDIQQMYVDVIEAASRAATGTSMQPGKFILSKYPGLNSKVNRLIYELNGNIATYLHTKIAAEWLQSDIDNDNLFDTVLNRGGKKSKLLNYRNEDALKAFIERTDKGGLNLSKRVFNYTSTFKQELEAGLGDGIVNGRSAQAMAADLKKHLNEPDKLFRRIKKDGKLQLSKPALNYNPGQGVYRSSFKNIMRVTRSETNMAYRKADNVRYQNSPFILGYIVKLSARHPTYDICDQLAGKYPVSFVFVGWHSHCICYEVPYMLTPAQYDLMENDFLAGKDISQIKYTDQAAPDASQAKTWYADNAEKVNGWASKPYFLTDNAAFFKKAA